MTAIQKPLEVGPTGFPELAVNFSMAVVETRSCKFCPGGERVSQVLNFYFLVRGDSVGFSDVLCWRYKRENFFQERFLAPLVGLRDAFSKEHLVGVFARYPEL